MQSSVITLSKVVDWSDRATSVLFGVDGAEVLLGGRKRHFGAESPVCDGRGLRVTTCGGRFVLSVFRKNKLMIAI